MKTAAAEVRVYTYLLPLREPLRVKDRVLRVREGILVRFRQPSGAEVLGEAAPLPGYSEESLEQALHQLLWHFREGDPARWWLPRPSVRAALEMLEAGRGDGPVSVAVNALAAGEPGEVADEEAARLRDCGCVKIKVGRGDPLDDARRVRAWSERLGPGTRLRLDANQAWDLHDAIAFARAAADLPIEYIEEPLRDPARLPKFSRETGVPIALDETLLAAGIPEGAGDWNLRAVVLKPSALGGFGRARALAVAAGKLGAQAVVSSLFESSAGLAQLAHFAATLDNASTHHGLDTAGVFARDTLVPPLRVQAGRLDAPALQGLPGLLDRGILREAGHV